MHGPFSKILGGPAPRPPRIDAPVKQAICNTTNHTVGQDSETEILNTALKMTVTQHKHKSN